MEILSEKSVSPIWVRSGDTLNVTYTDIHGLTTQLDSIEFDSEQVIDRIVFVRVGDEFGFVNGIGALIGKSK